MQEMDIQTAREERGLSQRALSRLAELPQARLSDWELGKSVASAAECAAISNALERFDQNPDGCIAQLGYTRKMNRIVGGATPALGSNGERPSGNAVPPLLAQVMAEHILANAWTHAVPSSLNSVAAS